MGLIIKNGVIYNGAESEPVIYSLDEREVGVWIDGRPLYQKTFRATSSSSTSTAAILADTGVGTEIVDFFGVINGARDIISTLDTNQWSYSWIAANKYQLANFAKGTSYAGLSTVATCRYIKTTDTPGSGTWAPSGAKSEHYSSNEHVVGTWIDGSPIYEKTYTITNISSNYTVVDLELVTSTINLIWIHEGFAINGIYCTGNVVPYANSSAAGELGMCGYINKNTNTVEYHYRSGSYLSGGTGYITIRYTKTTS